MNSEYDSVKLVVSKLYIKNIHEKLYLTGIFRQFIHESKDERKLKDMLCAAFKEIFGEDTVQHSGRGHRISFLVENKYDLESAEHVAPVDSVEYEDVTHLTQFQTGCKVAFRRKLGPTSLTYLHTGILFRGRNGVPNAILQVNDAGAAGYDPTTLHMAGAFQVYSTGDNADGPSVSILGAYLQERGVDMSKLIYRWSRIGEKRLCYDILNLNCDMVAN